MKLFIFACLMVSSLNLSASCEKCNEMQKFLKDEFFECVQNELLNATDESTFYETVLSNSAFYEGQRNILEKCLEKYGYRISIDP